MLVITRKLMEKVYIGSDICVTVVRLEGGQVRLGIDAPRHIPVVRTELLQEAPTPGLHATPTPIVEPECPARRPGSRPPGKNPRRRYPSGRLPPG